MCGHICGQLAVLLFSSDWVTAGTTFCTSPSLLRLAESFLAKLSPMQAFRWILPPSSAFYPATACHSRISWRDPALNKTRQRTSACDGVQIASLPRSLLCYRCSVRNMRCSLRLLWAVVHRSTWFPLIITAAHVRCSEFVICS